MRDGAPPTKQWWGNACFKYRRDGSSSAEETYKYGIIDPEWVEEVV